MNVKKLLQGILCLVAFFIVMSSHAQTINLYHPNTAPQVGFSRTIGNNSSVAFPAYPANGSGPCTMSFAIHNSAGPNLIPASIAITGANAADFVITSAPSLASIPAGTSTVANASYFTITYNPSTNAVENAVLTINSNATNIPAYVVNLRGPSRQLYGAKNPPFGTSTITTTPVNPISCLSPYTGIASPCIGRSGGLTYNISAVQLAGRTTTYWGPEVSKEGNLQLMLSLNGNIHGDNSDLTIPASVNSDREVLTYDPAVTASFGGLANGYAVFTGTSTRFTFNFGRVTSGIRCILRVTQPNNTTARPLIDPTSIGLSEQVGGLLQLTGNTDDFHANYKVEAFDPRLGTWRPYLDYYDDNSWYQNSCGVCAFITTSSGFYWNNLAPRNTANNPLIVAEGGTGTILSPANMNMSDDEDLPAFPNRMIYNFNSNPVLNFGTGVIKKSGVPVTPATTFTLQDLQNNLITYEHDGSETIADQFQFSARDSRGALMNDGNPANTNFSFGILITPVNDAPVTRDTVFTTSYILPITRNLVAYDPDLPANSITYSIVAGPTRGTISAFDPSTGQFTYTPTFGSPTTDNFTFRVYDGMVFSNTSTVTINQVNLPPTTNNSNIVTVEDVPVPGTITATDPEGGAVTFNIITTPAKGTLTSFNTTTGAYTYTPSLTKFGADYFTFKAQDPQGGLSEEDTVFVRIIPRLDPGDILVQDQSLVRLYDPATAQDTVITRGQGLTTTSGGGGINLAYKKGTSIFMFDGNTGLIKANPLTGVQSMVAARAGFSAGSPIGGPAGMLIDNAGRIVLADGSNGIVRVDTTTGVITSLFTAGLMSTPTGLVYLDNGDLIITNVAGGPFGAGTSKIMRITPAGVQTQIAAGGMVSVPLDLALIDQNTIVVSDAGSFMGGSDNIYKVNLTTGAVTSLATGGSIAIPSGLDYRSAKLYVVNKNGTKRVLDIDPVSGAQAILPGSALTNPWGLMIVKDAITVSATTTDETCAGLNDGTATVTFSNGVAPYSYTLDGGAPVSPITSPVTITGLSAGSHTIVIYDNAGSSTSITVLINAGIPNPTVGLTPATQTICTGSAVAINVSPALVSPIIYEPATSFTTNPGLFFDITNNSTIPITVNSVRLYMATPVLASTTPGQFNIYRTTTANTAVGNYNVPANWTLSASPTFNFPANPSPLVYWGDVNLGAGSFNLLPGESKGMYLVRVTNQFSIAYVPAANFVASFNNSDVTITSRNSSNGTFSAAGFDRTFYGRIGYASAYTYSWTRDNTTNVTGPNSGTTFPITDVLTNTTNTAQTTIYTVTASNGTCTSTATASVIVNPVPNATATPAAQTICTGSAITTIALSGNVSGTVYNWTRDNTATVTGIAASGTGNITGSLTHTGNAPVTVTFTITPTYTNAGTTCTGTAITATVVVNPVPDATATPAAQTICSGSAITTIALTGNVSGAVYNWTRNNAATVTGIAANGSGDISGILTNTTNAPVTVTFTVTPSYTNGGVTCTGTAITATVTVNPAPDVDQPANQVVCNAASTTAVNFTGSVAGTVFNWTNNNTSIGLAASGTGNIPAFTGTNTGNSPVVATVTVTPTIPGGSGVTTFNYTGTMQSFTVPAGITSIVINAKGAKGGNTTGESGGQNFIGGSGASMTGTFAVTPGQVLSILVGGQGGNKPAGGCGTGGGGGSFVVNAATSSPLLIAGGGGGAFHCSVLGGNNGGPGLSGTVSGAGIPTPARNGLPGVAGPNGGLCTGWGASGGGFSGNGAAPSGGGAVAGNMYPGAAAGNGGYGGGGGGYLIGCCGSAGAGGGYGGGSVGDTDGCAGGGGSSFNSGTSQVNMSGDNAANGIVTITYAAGIACTGSPKTFTYTINPTPNAVATPATQTVCSGTAITTIALTGNVTGTVYNWTRNNTATVTGIAANGSGNISGSLTNTTNAPVTVTFTVTPTYTNAGVTCTGTPITATVVVNPTPDVTQPANQVICNGASTAPVNFTGTVSGTVFTWTNNNTTIGLAASGTGNIASFNGTNTSNSPVTATITVTPTYTNGAVSCVGSPKTFTITVNPTATVNPIANQVVCNGAPTSPVNFTGNTSGTICATANEGGSITLTAPAGTVITSILFASYGTPNGTCGSFTIGGCHASGSMAIVSGFAIGQNSVTIPATNGVFGDPCFGVGKRLYVQAAYATAGTTVYNWINDQPSIGLAASGTGNIPSFTATNNGTAPVVATITVTPVYTNGAVSCPGTPATFTYTVNPTATVDPVANQVLCNGANSTPVNFTSQTTGGTIVYNWTNNTTSIGLAASGTGNIPSFVAVNLSAAPVVATITVTPTYTNAGVSCVGTPLSFTITVNPPPVIDPVADQVVCNNSATANIIFTTPTTGGTAVFNWTNNNTSIALAASGTGDILSFTAINTTNAPEIATITVVMTYTSGGINCVSLPITFTITVNPTPVVDQPASQVVCNNTLTAPVNFTSPTTGGTIVYNWTNSTPSIGLAASGTGDIAAFTAINTGNATVIAIITVTPSYTNAGTTCTGTAKAFTIAVNPTATVNPVANQVVCNGGSTTAVTFSSPTTGGTIVYNWTNNTTSIGLAASGTGNIASFTAINATTAPVTATITVTPTYTNGGTTCIGTSTTFTITVNPTATINAVANQVVCNAASTAAINFSSPTTGGTIVYNWTNNTTSIGLAASGTGNIASFIAMNTGTAPVVATITVTPVYTNGGVSCTGTAMNFTITVNPTPTINPVASQVLCHGSPTAAVTFSGSVPGTIYEWVNSNTSIGLAAAGTGNIASFIATNITNVAQVATITVTPVYDNGGTRCEGTATTFTITVNPIPTVNAVANQVACTGSTVTVNFTGAVAGTVYNWTNTNSSIGLGTTGSGNLSFVATNTSAIAIIGTVTVTPTYTNGGVTCTGTPVSFTIMINPVPTVNQVANQVLCNGSATAAITLTGPVSGAIYTWTNNNPSIGLAASGAGNIPSFTATNITNAPVVATVTVTGIYTNGGVTCTGPTMSFTITVNPTPTVNTVANQAVCNGANTSAITFAGTVAGTVFSWTNNNTSIGLLAAGIGNIPAFAAVNTTNAPVVATITVTPTYSNGGVSCTGPSTSFTITVNPRPIINDIADRVLCNGATSAPVIFTGPVAGTTFSWTNSNTAIGLAASGTGNLPAFTATNTTNAPIFATITVTPSAAGCTGVATNFTITVNPTATVNQPADQIVCHGNTTAAVNFTSPATGGTIVYNWTNNSPQIGLANSGSGNIPSFVANNATPFPVLATVTVTPSFNNGGVICTGTAMSFTITVNPQPNIVFNMPPRACLTDTLITLRALPAGGTWAGPGVSGGTFSPLAAGLGVKTLSYTFTNANGCTGLSYFNITVNDCKERHNVFATAIRLYPNPSNGQFKIRFLSDIYTEFNVRVINARGQMMNTYHFDNLRYGSEIPMDLRALPAGTYWLQIYNSSERAHFPFVIVK